tara:strand:+ start:151 stop:543 length:393 start_codon:yes stop_codon:yes gene_type:complete
MKNLKKDWVLFFDGGSRGEVEGVSIVEKSWKEVEEEFYEVLEENELLEDYLEKDNYVNEEWIFSEKLRIDFNDGDCVGYYVKLDSEEKIVKGFEMVGLFKKMINEEEEDYNVFMEKGFKLDELLGGLIEM